MFERFNESARRALFFARYEASRLGDKVIETRHLLLGLLRENDGATAELWKMLNISPREIVSQYPAVVDRISSSAELPLSEESIQILGYAVQEAESRHDDYVTPCHLLLAILRIPECEAAVLLAKYEVEYEILSEIARPLMVEAQRRAEIEERTPIILREAHYEMLDRIAAAMKLDGRRRENRQSLALAIVDAVADSSLAAETFSSIDHFRDQISRRLK
jgi:ATP-dependent Clp protease ATP-binding subunit ClpC